MSTPKALPTLGSTYHFTCCVCAHVSVDYLDEPTAMRFGLGAWEYDTASRSATCPHCVKPATTSGTGSGRKKMARKGKE